MNQQATQKFDRKSKKIHEKSKENFDKYTRSQREIIEESEKNHKFMKIQINPQEIQRNSPEVQLNPRKSKDIQGNQREIHKKFEKSK